MTGLEIAGCVFGVIFLIGITQLILGWFFGNMMFGKKPYTYQTALDREVKKGNIDEEFLKEFSQEEFQISGGNGYHIYGRYFLQEKKTTKTAVIMHGHAGNLIWSYKYAKIFQDMGYNWFVFDNRGCGKSGGKKYTMGYLEAGDLADVVDFAKSMVENAQIVLHGESLGASTSILAIKRIGDLKCVVADCGFASLRGEVKYQLHKHKMLWHFVGILSSVVGKIKYGFYYGDVSPVEELRSGKFKTPILFIHGTADAKTPVSMCLKMYDAYRGEKEIYLCEGAGHARTYSEDKEKYALLTEKFCEKHMENR